MDGVAQAHERLMRDASIQFGFPSPVPTPPPAPAEAHASLPAIDGGVLFWVVIILAVLGTVFLFARHLRFRSPGTRPAAAPPAPAAPAPVVLPRAALEEADVLAEAGRYGDAVHALLLRGVEAIRLRFPRALAPSHTSRDIARLPVLPDNTRRAFAGLAERTERAVFARRVLTREDWDACRALYAGLLVPGAPS